METNGKGDLGFFVELPGSFIRGSMEAEAISKIPVEAGFIHELAKKPGPSDDF